MMSFKLSSLAKDQNYRLDVYDVVGSTNQIALEYAMRGDAGKVWIVSKNQQGGRGRLGRQWQTPIGNLASTLLLNEAYPLQSIANLGFIAGVALAQTIDTLLHEAGLNERYSVKLKWPNDVLINGAKLCGILVETTNLAGSHYGIAIGMGTNIVTHPKNLPYNAISLGDLGINITAEELFESLSHHWHANYMLWQEGRGLAAIRDLWLQYAHGLGGAVNLMLNSKPVTGIFETINDDCCLIIRQGNGVLVTVTAGDVFFGDAHSVKPA